MEFNDMLKLIKNVPFDSVAWPGNWVWTNDSTGSFEVVQFCCIYENKDLPAKLHISADNRYKLYINGDFVGLGPQRGTLEKYYFDTYDLSLLKSKTGPYIISAIVWYDRETAPSAQISSRPGFFVVAEYYGDKMVSPLGTWKYKKYPDCETILVPEDMLCIGAGYDLPGFTMEDICPTREIFEKEFVHVKALGYAKNHKNGVPQLLLRWNLHPRTIPALIAERKNLGLCRRVIKQNSEHDDVLQKQISLLTQNSLSGKAKPVIIPANSRYKMLLDNQNIVAGYPILLTGGGKNASISITYQEALQANDDVRSKANRNEVGERKLIGITDRFRLDGRNNVVFETLWYRSWRYMELDIQTSEQPIELKSLFYRSTGYPLELKAKFESSEWFNRLIEPGFRTLQLCANETYIDCPGYEQLQYIGDTRIMALLSYVLCNDDRLAREAIDAFDRSRLVNGLTQGGYPNRHVSELPLFSLIYILMLNDFLAWRKDVDFIRKYMLGVETILYYFKSLTRANGLIGKQTLHPEKSCLYMPEWFFVDWTEGPGWKNGEPIAAACGDSFIVSFFYLYALQQAVNLFKVTGDIKRADQIDSVAKNIQNILRKEAFDTKRQIFVDDPSGLNISQHTNILAILTDTYLGVVDGQLLLDNILNNSGMAKATVYFKFYLFEAMYHIGRADMIWPELKVWHDMLDNGLTTFAETPEPARSDCHAWSSHPLYHFIVSILGIRPEQSGNGNFSIRPLLQAKTNPALPKVLGAEFNIPDGRCSIKLKACKDGWDIHMDFPPGISVSDPDLI
jgi:hypothetical protein